MTRDDVAHLIIRGFALWLATMTLVGIVTVARVSPPPGVSHAELFLLTAIPLVLAVVVWLIPRSLIRAMFVRPATDVPFALTARGIPALACFVVGLMAIADAIPEAASWVAMQYMLSRATDPSFGVAPWADSVVQRSVATGAGMVAHLAVGAVLLALSRRPNVWPIPDGDGETEPPAPAAPSPDAEP